MIPLGIGGVNGLLETTVIDGDVPFLLPLRMLKGLQSVIDLQNMKLHAKEYDVVIDLYELHSGHITIDIMKFDINGFKFPMNVPHCHEQDFQLPAEFHKVYLGTAAMAQPDFKNLNSISETNSSRERCNGDLALAHEGPRKSRQSCAGGNEKTNDGRDAGGP